MGRTQVELQSKGNYAMTETGRKGVIVKDWEPRNEGSLWDLEKAREKIFSYSLQKEPTRP